VLELDTGRSRVQALEFSPHGDRILAATWGGSIHLFDTGGQMRQTRFAGRYLRDAHFRDDGRVLAATGRDVALLLDPDAGTAAELEGHDRGLWCADLSADGSTMFTSSFDGTGRTWNRDGSPRAVLEGHDARVVDGVLSHDGARVATVAAGKVRLWDDAGNEMGRFSIAGSAVRQMAWSPAEHLLLVLGTGNEAFVIDGDGEQVAHFKTATPIRVAAWSPDGLRVALGEAGGGIELRPVDGSAPLRLAGHERLITALAWLPDGGLVSCGGDRMLRVWDNEGRELVVAGELKGHVRNIRVSPRGTLVALLFTSERRQKPWMLPLARLLR
jgi:WD40 repeat protein